MKNFSEKSIGTAFQRGVIFALNQLKSSSEIVKVLSKSNYPLQKTQVKATIRLLNDDDNEFYDFAIKNRGRKREITEENLDLIVKKVKDDRNLTASDIVRDPTLNLNGKCVKTISTYLNEAGLRARKPL